MDYLFRLFQNASQILNIPVNVQVSTPRDYFEQVEKEERENTLAFNRLSLDFRVLDERVGRQAANHLDYWTGYHSNRMAHKQIISKGFQLLSAVKRVTPRVFHPQI